MGILDKGHKYIKDGLDFTLINGDYKEIERIHYVQALCNTCGKKVTLHRGEWGSGTVKVCPNCVKIAKKQGKEVTEVKKESTKVGVGAIKPIVRIAPKTTEQSKPTQMFAIGSEIDNCKLLTLKGDILTFKCKKCGAEKNLNKQQVIRLGQTNGHICDCQELTSANVGLIKAIGEQKGNSKTPYRELPGWIYINEYVKGKNMWYIYRCGQCGKDSEFNQNQILNNKYFCATCKKMEKNKIVPLGNLDWIGYITKCRRVEKVYTNEKGIKVATLKCLLCGDTEDIALASVLRNELNTCTKCENRQVVLNCPICGKNHLKNSVKGLYSGINSDIICINKNEKISKEDLILEHDSKVRLQHIKSRYRGRYNFKKQLDACEDRGQLFVFEEGYTGTDGEFYNSCMCIKHNKFIGLTEDEQVDYRHEYCTDVRMIPYNGKKTLK